MPRTRSPRTPVGGHRVEILRPQAWGPAGPGRVARDPCKGETQVRIVEEIIDVTVPQVMEETVEVVKHVPHERVQTCAVEQIVDMTVPQIRKKLERLSSSFRKSASTLPSSNFGNKSSKS